MENENNNLMVFEGHNVEVFEWEGKVLFNPKHVAECLDIKNVNDNIRKMNEKQVIKLTNSDVGSTDFRKLNNRGENFLTESGVYKLIFKSHKEEAEKFQDWVTDEVLPTIRKTGGYVNNDELFINTYLPFADDTTKSLFKGTLETVRKQNEVIAEPKCATGTGIFTIADAYVMGMSGITVDEFKETKALDDADLFIAKAYANGRADDDNTAYVFDTTKLVEFVPTINTKTVSA